MTHLTISKAQPISDEIIDALTIDVTRSLPYGMKAEVAEQHMADDAAALVKLLHDTLPQGTWCRVVAEVARQWASDQGGIISARAWWTP